MWGDDYIKQEEAREPFDGIVLAAIIGMMVYSAVYFCWQWWMS